MRVYLLLILCLPIIKGFAQDKILTNGGMRIHCRIVREDSVTLYYILPHQGSTRAIRKADVYKYVKVLSADQPVTSVFSPALRGASEHELLLLKLAAGFANPLGEFGSMDLGRSTSGLAKPGYFFQVMAVLKLHKYIGVCVAYHNQTHSLDNDLVNNQFTNAYRGINFTTTTSDWKIRGFYGGLYLTLPVTSVEGLALFADCMIGLPTYISPEFVTTGSKGGSYNTVSQSSSSTIAVAWLGEAGLLYKLYRRFGISLSVNYFRGSANFSNVLISNTNNFSNYISFSQKFESLNIQLGILLTIE